MIPVTKPFLPSRETLDKYFDQIYERRWLTNDGPLVQELTSRLEEYLGVENLLLVANGTLALQIACRALGVSDPNQETQPEVITTPFTFIATASSLRWEGVKPVFVDIDPQDWCLNPVNIEAEINSNTRAILPVHVFGNACDVEAIDIIARKHKLKVIYDACHTFGVKYRDESLLKYGDAATLSFHATKLFHTGEGGAIVFKRKEDLEHARKMINFGITGPECIEELGVNAKMNELEAAMGLSVLDEIHHNLQARQNICDRYTRDLAGILQFQKRRKRLSCNAAYFPTVFTSEEEAVLVADELKKNNVFARRYFFPSLDTVDFLGQAEKQSISNDIASRILCLPIYFGLTEGQQSLITKIVSDTVNRVRGWS